MLEGKYDLDAVDYMIKDLQRFERQNRPRLRNNENKKEFYKDLSNKGHGNLDTSAAPAPNFKGIYTIGLNYDFL